MPRHPTDQDHNKSHAYAQKHAELRLSAAEYRDMAKHPSKAKTIVRDDRPPVPAQAFSLDLAPSVNSLYPGTRRRYKSPKYKSWEAAQIKRMHDDFNAQPSVTPAAIRITVPENRGDLDGRAKATIDLLVKAGVLPDDGPKYVREITLGFGAIPMMFVTVTAA